MMDFSSQAVQEIRTDQIQIDLALPGSANVTMQLAEGKLELSPRVLLKPTKVNPMKQLIARAIGDRLSDHL